MDFFLPSRSDSRQSREHGEMCRGWSVPLCRWRNSSKSVNVRHWEMRAQSWYHNIKCSPEYNRWKQWCNIPLVSKTTHFYESAIFKQISKYVKTLSQSLSTNTQWFLFVRYGFLASKSHWRRMVTRVKTNMIFLSKEKQKVFCITITAYMNW